MKNKKTVMTLVLIAAIAVSAYAQQYDSESDFAVKREESGITITKYLGSKREVRIPPSIQNLPVTGIGEEAFFNCADIKSVTIPDSVKSIGDGAFILCKGLTRVTIPNSVTSIGENTFTLCTGLTSVTIPKSVTSIGKSAFIYCTSLAEIKVAIGNSAYTAENGVLYNKAKTSLHTYPRGKKDVSFTIPNSVTNIVNSAFWGCESLTSITIGNSVTDIERYAFWGCESLPNVTIPNNITSIGESAFSNCKSLTSVTFEGTIPSGEFSSATPFPGDLRAKFYATNRINGTPGTYTRTNGTSETWTKQ